jgi:hypothetical protein
MMVHPDGGFQVLSAEADSLAFLRDTDEEQILVIGNRGPNARPARALSVKNAGIPDGTRFREIFTGQTLVVQDGHLSLPVLSMRVQIWQSIPFNPA